MRQAAQRAPGQGLFFLLDYIQADPLQMRQLLQNLIANGLKFHRVIADFMVQCGCPQGTGTGGPGYEIRCEYGHRRFGRGAVGMALAGRDTFLQAGGERFDYVPALNARADHAGALARLVVRSSPDWTAGAGAAPL